MTVIGKQGRVRKGDRAIPARLINGAMDALNKITNNVSTPARLQTAPRTQPFVRFEIVSHDGDFVLAKRFNPDGTKETTNTTIAKPPKLQRTPFDGQTRDGITYTYSSDFEREADNSSDTEDQIINPLYVAGDVIFAFKPANGTGVTDDSSDDVIWQEMEGSTAWSKVSA